MHDRFKKMSIKSKMVVCFQRWCDLAVNLRLMHLELPNLTFDAKFFSREVKYFGKYDNAFSVKEAWQELDFLCRELNVRPVSRTGKRKQKLTKERMIEKNQQKKEREFERERERSY